MLSRGLLTTAGTAAAGAAISRRLLPRKVSSVVVVLAGLWVFHFGCEGPVPQADAILVGGEIVGSEDPERGSLALAAGRIAALGKADEIRSLQGPDTRVIDLAGAAVVPSFIDHHVHLLNLGTSLLNRQLEDGLFVDLSGAATIEEIADRLLARASKLPSGRWILGKGWSQGRWGETALPTHHPLSPALPEHPVFLTRVDGHAGWANARAMEEAGINAATPDPPGGKILRMTDGQPSGVFLERANEPIVRRIPALEDDLIRRAFRLAAEGLAAQGVTEVFDAGFLSPPGVVDLGMDFEHVLGLLAEEDRAEPLPIDVNVMIPAPSPLADAATASPERFASIGPRIRITHLKLFVDGALGSRGAALTHPYRDDPSDRGVLRMDSEEIERLAGRALDAGLGVAAHAIGDRAIGETLDAYESILESRPELDRRRLRVEHFSYPSAEDQQRAVRLGVALSIQPNFVAPDSTGASMEDSRVGPQNAGRVYAWGRLEELGAVLLGGSDYFAGLGPPLLTFHCAVSRTNLDGLPVRGWHPEQRLSRQASLDSMTGGRRLKVGQPADFAVLSSNPLKEAESGLLDIEVLAAFRRGERTAGDVSRAR